MLTQMSYILLRLQPLAWVVAGFLVYFVMALSVTLLSGSATAGAAVANIVIFVVVLIWRAKQPQWIALPPTAEPKRTSQQFWWLTAATLALCWITGQAAASWVYTHVRSEHYDSNLAAQAGTPLLLLILLGVVLAPLGEEALMRGIAYPMARKIFSPLLAALITASVFALVHGNLVQIMVALPLGLLLAFVYERTQRLWSVIMLHVAFNAAAMLTPADLISHIATLSVIITGFIITLGCLWLMRPSAQLEPVVKERTSWLKYPPSQ